MSALSTLRASIVSAIVISVVAVTSTPVYALNSLSRKRNDINQDGVSDMFAFGDGPSGRCIYKWHGLGDGRLGSATAAQCADPVSYIIYPATVGDVTGDGIADVAGVTHYLDDPTNQCLVRFAGNASGGFNAGVTIGCSGWSSYRVNLAGGGDLNGDGRGDLISISDYDYCLYRFMGTATGGFSSGIRIGCGWGYYWNPTGVGDITGDGKADVVAVEISTACLYRWNGRGDGTLSAGVKIGCGWEPYMYSLSGAGDVNRDGNGDLYAMNKNDNTLHLWTGRGNGTFNAAVGVGVGWGTYAIAR